MCVWRRVEVECWRAQCHNVVQIIDRQLILSCDGLRTWRTVSTGDSRASSQDHLYDPRRCQMNDRRPDARLTLGPHKRRLCASCRVESSARMGLARSGSAWTTHAGVFDVSGSSASQNLSRYPSQSEASTAYSSSDANTSYTTSPAQSQTFPQASQAPSMPALYATTTSETSTTSSLLSSSLTFATPHSAISSSVALGSLPALSTSGISDRRPGTFHNLITGRDEPRYDNERYSRLNPAQNVQRFARRDFDDDLSSINQSIGALTTRDSPSASVPAYSFTTFQPSSHSGYSARSTGEDSEDLSNNGGGSSIGPTSYAPQPTTPERSRRLQSPVGHASNGGYTGTRRLARWTPLERYSDDEHRPHKRRA